MRVPATAARPVRPSHGRHKRAGRDSSRTVGLMGGPVERRGEARWGRGFSGSPRRRRILAIAVTGRIGTAAGVCSGSGGRVPQRPDRHGPAAGQRGPGAHSRAAGARALLVPGYGGSTTRSTSLAGRIRAAGRTATVVLTLPGTGTGSLVTDAAALNAAVGDALAHGAPSVDVIGYSAGGVGGPDLGPPR